MEINSDYLKRFQKKTRGQNSERAELIGRIEQFTNPSRIQAGYTPYTAEEIAIIIGKRKIKTPKLRDLVVQCEKASEPSRLFWGLLKSKK